MSKTRTQNAIYNSSIAIVIQILKILVSFINRTFFIYFLGVTYLGLNGLFTSILSMLSLAEMGMSTAIAVSLYKPLADKDFSKVQAYMKLFKKIYKTIALVVFCLGLIVSLFLSYFLKDVELTKEIYYIYFLFLGNSVISYLFTYKRTLLDADQKRYVNVTTDFIVFLIGSIIQWGILYSTKSYILYLILTISMTVISNFIISYKVDRTYNYLKNQSIAEINDKEKRSFFKNVKGTIISKISETIVFGTDNILMSSFISVNIVGLYSNYSMIVLNIQVVIMQLVSALSGSIGNLIHKEKNVEKALGILKKYQFLIFILSFFSTIGIILFINIFIEIWLGKQYVFSIGVVFVIAINFFIVNYRISFLTYINSYGLFWEQRIKNIIEALLNLVISLGLLLYTDLGIISVLLGTVLSSILTVLWYEPYSVYKFGLKVSPKNEFKKIIIHYSYTGIMLVMMYIVCVKLLINENIWIRFMYTIVVYFIVVVVTLLLFSKTKEYEYFKNIFKKIWRKLFK